MFADLNLLIKSHEELLKQVKDEHTFLKQRINELQLVCDNTAAKMKDIDKKDHLSDDLVDERANLSAKLVQDWIKLKTFKEKFENCDSCIEKMVHIHHELILKRLHVEIVHGVNINQ